MTEHSEESDPNARVTSPMQEFGGKEVTTGLIVLLVGLVIAYLIPALLL